MTVELSTDLADALRRLAASKGTNLDCLVDEAIRDYLEFSSITDLTPEEVAATQMAILPELENWLPPEPPEDPAP